MATKLILTDIDDTIKPIDEPLVPRCVIDAFHAAQAAGIRCGVCTGRARTWAGPFFGGDAACCETMVATNGLQVYLDGERVFEAEFPHEVLEEVRAIVAEVPGAGLICFDGPTPYLCAGTREDLLASFPAYGETARELGRIPDFVVGKANVFMNADEAAHAALVDRLNAEVTALDFDRARVGFSNMMPRGLNKGSGIRILCEAAGITTDDVVVFGDTNNDLPMFAAVANSVAVGNATPDAAAAARWHIGTCADHAVADAILALAAGEWTFER